MDVLPRLIGVLDSSGRAFEPKRRLERVEPGGRSESDWDSILEQNADLLADALREAEIIGEDSKLLFLGRQIDNIDLVFAEVYSDRQDFRRLVLLEDKLLGNREAKRQVLAQILDYARTAQDEWPRAKPEETFPQQVAWVADNWEAIQLGCRRGDFLLVIAGDGIDDRLVKLAQRFAGRDDPLTLTELALVSMALYKSGSELLLIPHVVSAVLRSEREITVRVEVEAVNGVRVQAAVTRDVGDEVEQASRGRLPVRDEVVQFLVSARGPLDASLAAICPGLKGTAKPRKSLEYWLTLKEEASAVFKIHFGGYERDTWSPIQVGLVIGTKNTSLRDEWRRRIEPVLETLPTGTAIDTGGPRTLRILTSFDWAVGADLDDAILETATRTLRRFAEVLVPLLVPERA